MIKRFRDQYGLSQKDMATYFGISRSYVAMLEMGVRTPSDRIIERLEILKKFFEENQEEAKLKPVQPEFPESMVEKKISELKAHLGKCESLLRDTVLVIQENARAKSKKIEKKENESQNEDFLRFLAKDGLSKKVRKVDLQKYLELLLQKESLHAQINYLKNLGGNEKNKT